jgi:hypothetical protein
MGKTAWAEVLAACITNDRRETVLAIMDKLDLNEYQRDVLYMAIDQMVADGFRVTAVSARREIFAKQRRHDADSPATPITKNRPSIGLSGPDLQKLIALKAFDLDHSGKRKVEWASATINDHKARVSFLSRMVAGTQATIDQHRYVINMLERAKVDTLAELIAKNPTAA